jgi:IS5 family transposase
MTEHIKRQMRRRSAIEPVIGHLKEDHRIGRNHLAGTIGDAINAVLAAVGYNFRRILTWIRFCVAIICAALALFKAQNPIFKASNPMPAIV